MNTLTFMWQAYKLALAALAKKRAAERDADERRAIAKAFNDRYCYRNLYNPKAPRLEGTAKGGIVTAANMSPEERAKRARKGVVVQIQREGFKDDLATAPHPSA